MEIDEINKSFEQQDTQTPEKKDLGNVEVSKDRGVGQIPEVVDEAATLARLEKNDELKKTGGPGGLPSDNVAKSDTYKIIEGILEEDLGYIYEELPPYMQKDFKDRAGEAASQIEELMHKVKVNLKKVVKIIVQWLRMIPGINKFYLEQEAKIKADKILIELHKK